MCLGLKGEVSSNVRVTAVQEANSGVCQECVVQEAECNLGREGNPLDNSPLSELGGCYDQLGSAWRKRFDFRDYSSSSLQMVYLRGEKKRLVLLSLCSYNT